MTTHVAQMPLDVGRDPVGKLCRTMVEAGQTGSLSLMSTSHGRLVMTISSIEARAKLTVREDDRQGPHYAKWKPSPFAKQPARHTEDLT